MYQLEIRTDSGFENIFNGTAEDCRAVQRGNYPTSDYRIYSADRKRDKHGDLAIPAELRRRKVTISPREPEALAKDAARWLTETGRKRVHVYPTGGPLSVSFRFRKALCEALTGCRTPYCRRVADELSAIQNIAERAGFEFVEVDPVEQFEVTAETLTEAIAA